MRKRHIIVWTILFILLCLSKPQLLANNSLLENVFVKELYFNIDYKKGKIGPNLILDNIRESSEFQAFKTMDASNFSIDNWGLFKNRIIELSSKNGYDSNKLKRCFQWLTESEYDLPVGAYLIKTQTQKLWIILVWRIEKYTKFLKQSIWVFDEETQRFIDLIRWG